MRKRSEVEKDANLYPAHPSPRLAKPDLPKKGSHLFESDKAFNDLIREDDIK